MRCIFYFVLILRTESLHRTRQGKMKSCSAFWGKPFFAAKSIGVLKDEICLAQGIADRPTSIRTRKIKLICNRTAPIQITFESSQAVTHSENAANIAGVTVGVPPRSVDNCLSAVELSLAIQQAQDDQAMIRNDVTVAAIFIVAIMSGEFCSGCVPIFA